MARIVSALGEKWKAHLGDSLTNSFFLLELEISYRNENKDGKRFAGKLVTELLLQSFVRHGLQPTSCKQLVLTVAADINLRNWNEVKATFEELLYAEEKQKAEQYCGCSDTSPVLIEPVVTLIGKKSIEETRTEKLGVILPRPLKRWQQDTFAEIGLSNSSELLTSKNTCIGPWRKTGWPAPPNDATQIFPIRTASARAGCYSYFGFFACQHEDFGTDEQYGRFKETCARGAVASHKGETGIIPTEHRYVKRKDGKWYPSLFKVKRLGKLDGDTRVPGFEIAERDVICGTEKRVEHLVAFDTVVANFH